MQKTSNYFLLIIAFISGFSIMAMEISASRLLAPYFGTSLFVWTNIIGIVLIALSCGYYFGGKLADKRPELNILLKLILVAGIFFLIVPGLTKYLVKFTDISELMAQPASATIFVSSLFTTILLFSMPLFLLGMVSPFIIKLYTFSQESRIGELSGIVFAVSTVGSILGTFLPTLFFIPVLGTKTTIYIFAIVLVFVGCFGFRANKLRLAVLAFLPLTFFYSNQAISKDNSSLITEAESAYQYIRVIENNAGTRYLVFNEGGGVQSVYNNDNILTGSYYDYFNLLPYLIESNNKNETLVIGLAGGTVARQLNYFFKKDINITGVEIDQKVINISKEYFGIDDSFVKIYNQDGRIFLRNSINKYDIIIVDAYAQELYIPWTLTTQEFWNLVKNNLNKGGIVSINVNSTTNNSDLLNSITNTMASIFDFVYKIKTNKDTWNYIIIATDNSLNFQMLAGPTINNELQNLANQFINNVENVEYNKDGLVLTDDRAPIEFMTEAMVFDYLR